VSSLKFDSGSYHFFLDLKLTHSWQKHWAKTFTLYSNTSLASRYAFLNLLYGIVGSWSKLKGSLPCLAHSLAMAGYPYFNKWWMKGIKSSIISRESHGYGSKGSKLVSLIFKNEAMSIILIRISLSKGIWTLFETRCLKIWKALSLKEDKSILYSLNLVNAWNVSPIWINLLSLLHVSKLYWYS